MKWHPNDPDPVPVPDPPDPADEKEWRIEYIEADDYWVSLPYATFRVNVRDGTVIDAAPIARWMIGRPWSYCIRWVLNKQGQIEQL